jgi:FixJ family two-component response regulator
MGNAPPVIIISGHGDIPMAVKAVQAGAINFVEKPFNEQELLDSVHRAFKVDSIQRGKNMKVDAIKEKITTLTKRENEVLYAITAGKRNKVIAADLNISLSTVEAHRGHVMQKMEAKSLSDLMRMVIYVENETVDAIE